MKFIDESGRMVLYLTQQERLRKRIAEVELEKTVKDRLNSIKFHLCQKKAVIDEDFCNESVYGNCTVLFITGFIRMN